MEMNNSPVEQMDEGLDLQLYFSLFLQWAWLILLSALVAGATSYFFSIRTTPSYQSSTTVLVNEAPATKATDYSSVMMSQQLTSTYAHMMSQDPILSQVADQVGITNPLKDIKEWITVTPVRDTQLIQVTVETTDPTLSANIANAVATVFAAQIQNIQTQRFAKSKANLETQLIDTEKQITTYTTQSEQAKTTEEKDRFDAKVTQYSQIYANLIQSYEQVRLSEAQTTSSVVQVEPATANLVPVKPQVMRNTLLAAVVGLLLAAGLIVVIETLDDTIKTPEDITRRFKQPVLGVINHQIPDKNAPITLTDPRSPTTEAYRGLRTNVSYSSVDHPLRTLLVTSAEPGEGKTTTVSNLGVVMAQNGKQVIIADCDLRHPRVHTYFGLANREGMSTLFTQPDADTLHNTCQPTKVERLSVITTGSLPPNPSELMGSKKMQTILGTMLQSADVVLIDTPPTLAVTDAVALSHSIDGVLLVVRPGKTRISALKQTLEQLHQVNARVLGVVLNDVITRGKYYGYHYKYYRNYSAYQDHYGTKGKGKKRV